MNALVYFLSIYGLSWIVVYSKITLPIRQSLYNNRESKIVNFLYELTNCIICTSWWVGLFTLLTPFPYDVFQYQYNGMYLFLPFAASGLIAFVSEYTSEKM